MSKQFLTHEDIEDLLDNVLQVTKKTYWKNDKIQFNCPIHGESNPSAGINANYLKDGVTYQVFNCFSCGESGSLVWLVFRALPDEFKSVHEVESFLVDRYKVSSTFLDYSGSELPRYEEMLEKLPDKREVLPKYKLAPFRSGKETYQYFFDRGFEADDVEEYMIGRDLEEKTVTFPIFYEDGNLAGFIGRYINPHRPKNMRYKVYDFVKSLHLYPIDKLEVKKANIILVEGMLDAITLRKWGYTNVLSSMGLEISREQANILQNKCKVVTLLYDSDKRGREATLKVKNLLQKTGLIVKVPEYPENLEGKDPQEWGRVTTDFLIDSAKLLGSVKMSRM